jgi:hypothetical protein
MLYPLSYEGGDGVCAGQTIREAHRGRAACPIPALGVPDRAVSDGFLNRSSSPASIRRDVMVVELGQFSGEKDSRSPAGVAG